MERERERDGEQVSETLVFDLAVTRLIVIQHYTECWHLQSLKVLRSFAFVACYIVFDRNENFAVCQVTL